VAKDGRYTELAAPATLALRKCRVDGLCAGSREEKKTDTTAVNNTSAIKL
jgi:hypothetical protein